MNKEWGFLVHKGIVKSVIGCRHISSRLIFNRFTPTLSYDDNEFEEFYTELQSLVNQTRKWYNTGGGR